MLTALNFDPYIADYAVKPRLWVDDGQLAEIDFLKDTHVFSNLELLKMWSETTPKLIFPQRKIGALEDGYEANFLVLEGNPIQDFINVKRISMRVKQGRPLVVKFLILLTPGG